MKVKICGIRSIEDARAALDAGAWALGFIFHRASKRYIEPEAAARIVKELPRETLSIGVFVDDSPEELNAIVRAVGLRGAQLHGGQDAAFAARVESETVIKAFRVAEGFDVEAIRGFPGRRILLDAFDAKQPGGTGKSFDWSVARRAGSIAPVILAGGIDPDNVSEAIREARPDAIDVSSGVEASPGVKDSRKIRRLFEAIQNHERQA